MKRQEIIQLKKNFYDESVKIESPILNKKAEDFIHGKVWSRYNSINYPHEREVLLARKNHKCNVCDKKNIKKGDCYFRRSFGQMWTIKACSIKCFIEGLPN